MNRIFEPARETVVAADVDVLVVGAGTAGCTAAIAAARAGASVVLTEKFGMVGGCPTSGRCSHIGSYFHDYDGNLILDGLPKEIIDRVVQKGGTHYPCFETTTLGTDTRPIYFMIDPQVTEFVLLQMLQEANVRLMLHTMYVDPVMDSTIVQGGIFENKSGRFAILAKIVVDASGEGDVAAGAGVPCFQNNELDWLQTYGFISRIGNVNVDKFMEYFLSLPAGKPDPTFDEWLPKQTGWKLENLRKDWYWHHFLDPQPGGWGVHGPDPESTLFCKDTLDWFRKRWESEGEFAYVGIHYFRDLIRKAVDAGDLQFICKDKIKGIDIGYNFDGITGAKWKHGEVLINIVCPQPGFNAFDTDDVTSLEIASRERTMELAAFFKKYMPGFQDSYLVDTSMQALQRHIRFAEAECGLTEKDIKFNNGFDDTIFLSMIRLTGKIRQFPYRMLLPKDVDHLLMAGKFVVGSVCVRPIISIMAMGQAAGAAAALSSLNDISPKELAISDLQEELQRQHVILEAPAIAQ